MFITVFGDGGRMAERIRSSCEMCGKNVGTRAYTVQGVRMNLCIDCSKFGAEYNDPRASSSARSSPSTTDSVIQERLEKRERRMKTKDIYTGTESTVLREDAGKVVGDAIRATGMSVKDFSASIGEKELTISKIINGALVPNDKIIAKLEKALGVKLYEAVTTAQMQSSGQSTGMTLGSFIRTGKKRSFRDYLAFRVLGELRDVDTGVPQHQQSRDGGRYAELLRYGPALLRELPVIDAVPCGHRHEPSEDVLLLVLLRRGGRGSGRRLPGLQLGLRHRFGAGDQFGGRPVVQRDLHGIEVEGGLQVAVRIIHASVGYQDPDETGRGSGRHPPEVDEDAHGELLLRDQVLSAGAEESGGAYLGLVHSLPPYLPVMRSPFDG